jgi:protein-S-isoprenylcysteine O-methyltransferase Ste14
MNAGGAMNVSTLWTWLFWTWMASEIAVAVATRTKRSSGNVRDRGSQLILWIVIVASVTGSNWIHAIAPANMFDGAHWLRPASVTVLAAGLAIRWTAIITLGKSFSANVAVHESQKVHRTGLYRVVRHPSYLGLLLILVAIGLHSRNWMSFAVVLLPTTAALLYRIHVEEAALNQALGDEYAAYSRVTKRLVPGVF